MDFSFQLYSARNFPPLDGVLGRVAKLGYKQVEGFGGLYAEADSLAAALKQHGLTMPTGHFGLAQLKDTEAALKTAETLGMRFLYCPAIPKEERDGQPDSKWVELGETLAKLGEAFRKRGFGFGWHNHDFEFRPTASGKLPMDIILDTAPNNDWEMDVAWVVRVATIRSSGSRSTAAASMPCTSRTSLLQARTPTRMAGPMSATAPWTGRRLRLPSRPTPTPATG